MDRQEVYQQIQETLGVVPAMFRALPDATLELEWHLFKRVQFDPGPIPNKYRELIGMAVAAVTRCPYCTFYHTELARLNGATEAEIEDALHFTKSSVGWSAYLNGLQLDYGEFRRDIRQACEHVRSLTAGSRE